MQHTRRTKRPLTIAMTIFLLAIVLIPIAVTSLAATVQYFQLAPGDQIQVNCATSLSAGPVQGTTATLNCAAPTAAATPAPASAPVISAVTGVKDGQTVSGNAVIEAQVSGTSIASVVFKLDGPTPAQHTERTAPYFFMGDPNGVPAGWDTTKFANGAYSLTVTATDAAGRSGVKLVRFTVANNVTAPVPPSAPTAVPTKAPALPTAVIPAPTAAPTQAPPAPPASGGTVFLQAQGKDLMFGNQKVILKGTNFDNINALGAGIGSNNVNDITFGDADYAELARQGGNHVRLGLSFSWYQQNKTAFFQKMDQQVGFAKKHGIFLVFNMFTTPGNCYEGYSNHCGFWGSSSEQQQLQAFWVDMATRYKNEPAVAGYDLLNEPTPPQGCGQWFPIAQRIRDAVAAVSPNQLVFVNTCSDPGNDLRYNNPPKGKNIVHEVHDYAPMDMTHDMFSPGSTYPGTAKEWFGSCYVDKNVFATGQGCPEMNIRESYGFNWAAQNNVPIYVGEWGASSVLKGYVQYHKDRAELYRDWDVNHAHYTWKHQTIKTGGYYQWGMYSSNPSQTDDPAKLDAVKIAWAGAVRPNFGSGTVSVPSAPSAPAPTQAPAQPAPQAPQAPAPTAQPAPQAPQAPATGATFFRGYDLGGTGATVDGNAWQAGSTADLKLNGTDFGNQWLTLAPAADASRDAMLKNWKQHWAFDIAMGNVPNGSYQVYVYVVQDWDDPNAKPVNFKLEGQNVGGYTPGKAGSWQKLGPFTASVTDGAINLTASGLSNVAGIEVWRSN
jgi:hypothetical protein